MWYWKSGIINGKTHLYLWIGLMRESVERLESAIKYLKEKHCEEACVFGRSDK
jgi:hypothetical protein